MCVGLNNPLMLNQYVGKWVNPDINPIYVGFFLRDSKNVSFVVVGLVKTCLDLILSHGWGGLNSGRT